MAAVALSHLKLGMLFAILLLRLLFVELRDRGVCIGDDAAWVGLGDAIDGASAAIGGSVCARNCLRRWWSGWHFSC